MIKEPAVPMLGWTTPEIPVAVFTVKHECATWLKPLIEMGRPFKVERWRDGTSYSPTDITEDFYHD